MKAQDQLVGALDRLLEVVVLLNHDMTASLAAEDLTVARATLLWTLADRGPSPQKALADALGVTARNVTGLVDGLEAGGYVTRERHPEDRRSVLVTLTAQGAEWATRQRREQAGLARALFGAMDPARFEGLVGGLDDVLKSLRDLGLEARPE
jgi:DNA-binding MarR family transcriptional regulator